jgi:hypothetical protein
MPSFTLETDPNVVLLALRPLLIPVYESWELSIPKALQIVAENGWESSGHLVSHLIRAEAKRFLRDRSCPIEIDDIPRSVTMEQIAMEGLSTKFEGITVKILKGLEIPKAATEPRKAFYQQAHVGLWVAGVVPPINGLLVMWDCSETGANLQLNLCCTKDSTARDYWMIPIPHPATWMIVGKRTQKQLDDLDDLLADSVKKKSEN